MSLIPVLVLLVVTCLTYDVKTQLQDVLIPDRIAKITYDEVLFAYDTILLST